MKKVEEEYRYISYSFPFTGKLLIILYTFYTWALLLLYYNIVLAVTLPNKLE